MVKIVFMVNQLHLTAITKMSLNMIDLGKFSLLISWMVLFTTVGCRNQLKLDDTPPQPTTNESRVSKLITKELADTSKVTGTTEKVVINGKQFPVIISSTAYYTYDEKNRIKTNTINYLSGEKDSISYVYQGTTLSIKTVHIDVTKQRTETRQTMMLNSQGFVEKQPYYEAKYDRNGYLTSLSNCCSIITLDNGNMITRSIVPSPGDPTYTFNYTYDSDKLSVPPILTFYGHNSRNLPTGYRVEEKTKYEVNPKIYIAQYIYQINTGALVEREVFYANETDVKTPFLFGGQRLIIKEYEYVKPQ